MNKVYNDNYVSLDKTTKYLEIKQVALHSWICNPDNEVLTHKIGDFVSLKETKLMLGCRVVRVL